MSGSSGFVVLLTIASAALACVDIFAVVAFSTFSWGVEEDNLIFVFVAVTFGAHEAGNHADHVQLRDIIINTKGAHAGILTPSVTAKLVR